MSENHVQSDQTGLDRVGVVGGGTMGAGIVHALLAAGTRVVLVEADAAAAARATDRVRDPGRGRAPREAGRPAAAAARRPGHGRRPGRARSATS